MNKVTKYLALLLFSALVVSCGANNGNQAQAENKNSVSNKEINKKDKKMKAIHLTKAEFLKKVVDFEGNPSEWKYLGDKPALIDFYASWCGPCKTIAPILEELAAEYEGQIYIYKVDTEAEQELAAAFGIRSIPTLLFAPMTGNPQIAQGALPKANLKQAIEEVLLKK
ncbi:Thioredoxin [Bacteroidales bacterium CF]|jgi:thioredoxin|nr:Thioredoxin [Bacteroidales bacterium CF]NCB97036.1 thioredoxin [Bacteroidia bacterium]